HDAAFGGGDDGADEGRRGRGAAREFSAAEAHAEHAPRLALGDLGPEQARIVLALQRDEMAAGIEHGHGERLELEAPPVLERFVDDDRGLGEGDIGHFMFSERFSREYWSASAR